jgi:non-specific serine/threonine protein kinase
VATPIDALPVWFTPFIGREREVSQICALLARDGVRVVTLTGPGGVGKTRLAFAAGEQSAFASGRRLIGIDLSPITDPRLVRLAIAQRLGVRETGRDPLERQVTEFLRKEPTLLLLDNFEQVIEAAPLLARLLIACAQLQIVVTSRERLRISAEHAIEVPSLTLPDATQGQSAELLMQFEAVRLFVERAAASSQDFALTERNAGAVAEICTRLEGLPLAIELAAARVQALPLSVMLQRLGQSLPMLTSGSRDQPSRQRTMRDAIGWSYELLSKEEQALFRHLSVFAGGFTLPAAEAVATLAAVLVGLLSLVDKSLLRQEDQLDGHVRFRMLETVREFGRERLEAAAEFEATLDRHAAFYLTVAEMRNPAIPVPGDFAWIARLVPELDNLRLALTNLERQTDALPLLRIATALYEFWFVRGLADEAAAWLQLALDRAPAAPPGLRARATGALGTLAWYRGDYAQAAPLYARERELAEESGDNYAIAEALIHLGVLDYRIGALEQAIIHMSEALARLLQLGEDVPAAIPMTTVVYTVLGDIAHVQNDLVTATEYYERAIDPRRSSTSNAWSVPDALGGLGAVLVLRGDYERAVAVYLDGLERALGNSDAPHAASILTGLAAIAAQRGQPERAARLLGAAERLRVRIRAVVYPRDRDVLDLALTSLGSVLDETSLAALRTEGGALDAAQTLESARAIVTTDRRAGSMTTSPPVTPFRLTPRELEVLRLLVDGRSDAQIGETLFISRRTVTTHTSRIFEKMGVVGRTEAAAMAVRRGIV